MAASKSKAATNRSIMKLVAIAILSTSCSLTFQDSVRSSGYDCSTSYGWAASDLVLGVANAYVASTGGNVSEQPGYVLPAEILAGTFIASAAIGAYKAHHCAVYREDPAVIAQMHADQERMAEAAARGRAEGEAAAAAQAAACAAQGGCNPPPSDQQAQACPDGQQLGGPFSDRCFQCPDGAAIGGFQNSECMCPEGTSSNGIVCVAPTTEAAAPAPHHRHHREQVAQPQPAPYNNQVHLSCNGRVMVDTSFTDKNSCVAFAAKNVYKCNGLELPISCD